MNKTIFAAAAALLATAALPPASAQAQAWPTRTITFIVPFPAGGGTDAYARPIAAQMDASLNQRIIIENKGGAGGTTGASQAAKARPDGYTFLVGAAHHTIAPSIYPKLDYDLLSDFIPVGVIAQPPHVVVVNPDKVAAKTLRELIDFLGKNPGKLNFASAGNGTTHHLAGELFKIMTKTSISHVPYRGAGPLMQDLVAGHVEMAFDGLGSSAPQIAAGKLRALAIAAPQRTPAFPDLPTTSEAGLPGFEFATWYGLFAPKGTPPEAVTRLTEEIKKALGTALIRETWAKNGSPIPNVYGAEMAKLAAADIARWGKVVKEAGVKAE